MTMPEFPVPKYRRFPRGGGYETTIFPELLYSKDGLLSGIGAIWPYDNHACVLVGWRIGRWRRYIEVGDHAKYELSARGWLGWATTKFWKQVRVIEARRRSEERKRGHKKRKQSP